MTSEWQPLHVSSRRDDSPLLVKCAFEADRYVIHVTDLCNIWSESLDRQDVTQRAHDDGCSIDPDDGDTQFGILLEKIEATFKGNEGTELIVKKGPSKADLVISSVSPLPKPLSPLRWSIYLSQLPDSAMRTHVTLPLMGASFVQNQQIEQLVLLLQEKDNLIGKIVDKVESLGLDLSHMFPQAGATRFSKKKAQREHILKQVRGLAPFDRQAWNAESGSAIQSTPSFSEVAQVAFAGSGSVLGRSIGQSAAFVGSSTSGETMERSSLVQRPRVVQHEPSQGESQLDGFQRQATPSELNPGDGSPQRETKSHEAEEKIPDKKGEIVDDDDETTEDEDDALDLDAKTTMATVVESPPKPNSPKPSARPDLTTQSTPSPRKLGLLGKSKRIDRSADPNQESEDEVETTSKTALLSPRKIPNKEPRQSQPPHQASRKIGKIGGHTTKEGSLPSSNISLSKNEDTSELMAGRNGPSAVQSEVNSSRPTLVQQEQPEASGQQRQSTPAVEEDPQARADRKRLELKREMEERSKAAPTKKKRRF